MEPTPPRITYPFAALVGQEEMKLALLLNVIEPRIGGVMILGHRGTGKSTAVRALADVMPPIEAVAGCAFNCPPDRTLGLCARCRPDGEGTATPATVPVPVVDLPLGATEDRVTGTLDLEAALLHGRPVFEPGLFARAHRGFLYIDEANLLEDHLVDLLLDVAASGENLVEREALSVRHPARFVLVGTGNPEEGELRPQLIDRFGLCAMIETESDPAQRVEVVRRRMAFDDDPEAFRTRWSEETTGLRERLAAAATRHAECRIDDDLIAVVAAICGELGVDGHRGELTMARAARARAAWQERTAASPDDVRAVARLALRHRLRRDPLDTRDLGHRIDEAVSRHLDAAR